VSARGIGAVLLLVAGCHDLEKIREVDPVAPAQIGGPDAGPRDTSANAEAGALTSPADAAALGFRVVSTSPAADATGVDPGGALTVTFSDPLAAESVNASTVRLLRGEDVVPCDLMVVGDTVTATPKDQPLVLAGRYEIQLADVILDASHRSLGGPRSFAFTTRDGTFKQVFTTWPMADANGQPRLAINNHGNAYAIYGGKRTDSTWTAFIYHFDVAKGMWSQAVSYDAMPQASVFSPDIAMDEQDHACATWCGGWFDGTLVNAARFPVGFGQWLREDLTNSGVELADSARVGLAGTGDLMVIWHDRNAGGDDTVMRWSRGPGTISSSKDQVDKRTMNATWSPAPAIAAGAAASDLVVAWADSQGAINVRSGYSEKVPLSNPGSAMPSVAVDGIGDATVVWQHSGASTQIFAARKPHGGSWPQVGSATPLSESQHNATTPMIVANGVNGFLAIWAQERGTAPPVKQIVANAWSPEQAAWAGAMAIPQTDTSTEADQPHAALDALGNGLLTWRQAGHDIWTARLIGGKYQSVQKLSKAPSASAPRAGLDARGRGFVLWTQDNSVVVARFE
jgi:hypothetical protein